MPTLPNPAEARPKLVEALKLDLLGLHLSLSTPAHRHNGKQWRHEEKRQSTQSKIRQRFRLFI
jgi:hypothetical protein